MRSIALMWGLVLAVGFACSAPGEVVSHGDAAEAMPEALPQELLATIESFYAAIESGDVEARIALFADDILMMPNHWTISRGREAIAASLRGVEGAVFKIRDRDVVKAFVRDDVAYTVNSYHYTYHSQGDGPQWHKTKNVHVWRRDPAGHWKLELDIWNSDVPISAFADE